MAATTICMYVNEFLKKMYREKKINLVLFLSIQPI